MDTIIPMYNLRKHKRACKSSWNPIGSVKSCALTIPWNSVKLVKISLGIVVRWHHTEIGNKWDWWKSSAQSKGRHLCCIVAIRSEWKSVGRFDGMLHLSAKRHRFIIWWEDALWETFLGNHLKDRLFHLVHWLSITLFLRRTSQVSINLERKSYLDCSSDTHCTRGELGRVTYRSQTLRSWRRWTPRKSTRKDSMRRGDISQKNKENLFFQSQMDESNPLKKIKTWEHPPWHQFKEKVTLIFLENQKGFSTTSRLTNGCRWSK